MIDLFIAVAAVTVVILVTAQQVKTYKKDGYTAFLVETVLVAMKIA